MTSTHIEIPSTTRLGAQLRSLVDSLASNKSQVSRSKEIYDQLAFGGDFASLGAALGLTGQTAASDAEAIYNLIGSIVTELDGDTFLTQLLARLG